jgi:thiamine-phosphate pyrophosphorylase
MNRFARGLYAVTPDEPDTAVLVARVAAALDGGAATVQYRNKQAPLKLRREQAIALTGLCRARRVPLVVNDELSLALEIGADGVHLGRDDGEIAAARARLGSRLLGASCYSSLDLALAAAAAGATYVAFGSVFPSTTKPDASRVPLALFGAAKKRLAIPLVAIGGITVENAPDLIAAGVDAVAVISGLFDAEDIEARARAFQRLFQGEAST